MDNYDDGHFNLYSYEMTPLINLYFFTKLWKRHKMNIILKDLNSSNGVLKCTTRGREALNHSPE